MSVLILDLVLCGSGWVADEGVGGARYVEMLSWEMLTGGGPPTP